MHYLVLQHLGCATHVSQPSIPAKRWSKERSHAVRHLHTESKRVFPVPEGTDYLLPSHTLSPQAMKHQLIGLQVDGMLVLQQEGCYFEFQLPLSLDTVALDDDHSVPTV